MEAWNNTVKHADARTVTTMIDAGGGAITVRVSDDGRGFDKAAVQPGHLGLQTMRERAAAAGAAFDLASAPGAGTTICLRLPKGQASLPGGLPQGEGARHGQ